MSGRGGWREKSGRKLKFGELTTAIRVPISWLEFLNPYLESGISPVDSVQNQLAEKDRIISQLEAELKMYKTNFETVQNQPSAEFDSVQNQTAHSNNDIVEWARVIHAENPTLSKSAVARQICQQFGVKFETARDKLKKLW